MAVHVLIVDDSAHFLGAARALLEGQGMPVLAVAPTGEEARRLVSELRPDLVLVDIDLGNESGIDLARSIIPTGPEAAPQVILISAYPQEDVVDLIGTCEAIRFLSKSSLSAAKHAKPSVVLVEIGTTSGRLNVVARDDGVGGADATRGRA